MAAKYINGDFANRSLAYLVWAASVIAALIVVGAMILAGIRILAERHGGHGCSN
jgi:hypothetical protein